MTQKEILWGTVSELLPGPSHCPGRSLQDQPPLSLLSVFDVLAGLTSTAVRPIWAHWSLTVMIKGQCSKAYCPWNINVWAAKLPFPRGRSGHVWDAAKSLSQMDAGGPLVAAARCSRTAPAKRTRDPLSTRLPCSFEEPSSRVFIFVQKITSGNESVPSWGLPVGQGV